jgi:5'-3' exoribonuclease 2
MGIPVLFKTLISDYHNIIVPVENVSVDNLCFDLNCLIHPACAQVEGGDEPAMIQSILDNIDKLIQVTGASFVYVAIDGPAPKAKMIQQRVRRLKSVLEEKEWDTNAITPGTTFMNHLNERLHEKYDSKEHVVISDSLEPGEGEHKILQYIKQEKELFTNKHTCIYGLDADLIMLGLVSGLKNLYLLRERTSFNIEQMEGEYLYLDIQALRKEITASFPGIPKQRVINDYIFICFFLGNDFIKNSPALHLRYDGLTHVMDAYKQCQEKHSHKFYLINPKTQRVIHWSNLVEYVSLLESWEQSIMKDMFDVRLKQHRKYRRIYDDIQRNKGRVQGSAKHSSKHSPGKPSFPAEDIMRHKPIIFMDDEKNIFQSPNWIQRYNLYTLTGGFDMISVNSLSQQVDQVCLSYLESLVWTAHYYFRGCISQEWYYPYEFAPTLHDVKSYLQRHSKVTVPTHEQFYSPIDQLRFVLPMQSYHLCEGLLGEEKDTITNIEKEHTLLKRYDWECHPIFPD